MRAPSILPWLAVLAACGEDPPPPIPYGAMAPLAGDAGRGGFRFGVATAATQIEDLNPATDWYLWTRPIAEGGLGKGTFVGDAVRGYTKHLEDLARVADRPDDAGGHPRRPVLRQGPGGVAGLCLTRTVAAGPFAASSQAA